MHASDWPMSYHPAEVINDADPLFSGRIQVLATGLYPSPIWVEPLYATGVFAVPAVLDKVALFQVGPQQYRWGFALREKADPLPTALLLEYPMRRALLSKPPAPGMEPAMMGFDAAGIAYVGHFNATEPMVLGQKLATALQHIIDAGNSMVSGIGTSTAPPGGGTITPGPEIADATASLTSAATALLEILSTVAKVAATPTT